MAFCPVCLTEIRSISDLCPHVAVVFPPVGSVGTVYVGGYPRDAVCDDVEVLACLTLIGTLPDGSRVYFAPSPKVFLDALRSSRSSGVPLVIVYQSLWRELGMEHEEWARH